MCLLKLEPFGSDSRTLKNYTVFLHGKKFLNLTWILVVSGALGFGILKSNKECGCCSDCD